MVYIARILSSQSQQLITPATLRKIDFRVRVRKTANAGVSYTHGAHVFVGDVLVR